MRIQPVMVTTRGCGPLGCVLVLIPVLAVIGLGWALSTAIDAILPGDVPWWVDVLVVLLGLNLLIRLTTRRIRRRLGVDSRRGGPPDVIDV